MVLFRVMFPSWDLLDQRFREKKHFHITTLYEMFKLLVWILGFWIPKYETFTKPNCERSSERSGKLMARLTCSLRRMVCIILFILYICVCFKVYWLLHWRRRLYWFQAHLCRGHRENGGSAHGPQHPGRAWRSVLHCGQKSSWAWIYSSSIL